MMSEMGKMKMVILVASVGFNSIMLLTLMRHTERIKYYRQGLSITVGALNKAYAMLDADGRRELERDVDEGLEFMKIVNG